MRLSWTHVAERFPNRTKAAVQVRWKRLASEQLRKAHAFKVRGEPKAWDEEQEEQVGQRFDCRVDVLQLIWCVQLRELKRQGLTNQDIASRMGRSAASVQHRWRKIADEGEKRKRVRFGKAEDQLVC